MVLNNVVSFLIAGSILLLAFLLLTNPLQINKKGNFYFGLCSLCWSTFWLDEALADQVFVHRPLFILTKGIIQFLVPFLFFISTLFYTKPIYKFTKKDSLHLLLPMSYLTLLYYQLFSNQSINNTPIVILIILNALFYISLAYFTVVKHQRDIETFVSTKEPVDLNWIKMIIYAITCSIISTALYTTFINTQALNLYINIFFLIIAYMIAYFAIKQGEIYPKNIDVNQIVHAQEIEKEQDKNTLMDQADLNLYKEQLSALMIQQNPYLDSDLNLVKLAEKLGVSTHQLSYVINKGFNENFFQFINAYRVEKAKELLNNPKYDAYTILAIGYESGFNSKTTFNTTFKKITKITPTQYRNMRSNL